MERLSVLIVESNPADTTLIRDCLEQSKGSVVEIQSAPSLDAAQNLTAHYDFEAILVNPILPDAQGLEVIRRLLASAPEAALIVIADEGEDLGFALKSVRFGAQDYLEKRHLSPVVLHKAILYAIERKIILQEKEELLHDFALALKKLDSLEQVLPMCSYCKKVQWNGDLWLNLEEYADRFRKNRNYRPICPDCSSKI